MDYHKKCLVSLLAWLVGLGPHLDAQDAAATTLEQLSALEGYIHTAEKGYRIAKDGLYLIRDIRNGEYDLHRVYFGSLRSVDMGVLNDPVLTSAYSEAMATNQLFLLAVKTYLASGWLQPGEQDYILSVREKVGDEIAEDLLVLEMITEDGELSMTDGERMENIQWVSIDIHGRYMALKNWLADIGWLIMARTGEQLFTGTLKKWYGLQ